ncbi:MAG: hypothetical protein LBH21_06220, partial [Gracilibacteraceae bacterium]|nr:hypothetical protein [Gracilibacteraceae bacterium]
MKKRIFTLILGVALLLTTAFPVPVSAAWVELWHAGYIYYDGSIWADGSVPIQGEVISVGEDQNILYYEDTKGFLNNPSPATASLLVDREGNPLENYRAVPEYPDFDL